jgi:hypothetical protein
MADVVLIIGPGGEGGTFLDWSLHYLIGDTSTKLVLVDRLKHSVHGLLNYRIPNNPITIQGNAHKHKKTHPTEVILQQCVDLLHEVDDENIKIHTMYCVPSDSSYRQFHSYQNFVKHAITTFTNLKFIQLYHSPDIIEELVHRTHTKISDNVELVDDIRSRITVACNDTNTVMSDANVYSLSIKDMFYNLEVEIYNILSWLNITLQKEKYESWLSVYKEWQAAQSFGTTQSILV